MSDKDQLTPPPTAGTAISTASSAPTPDPLERNDDPEPNRPDVVIPVVPVAEGQPLSELALRVTALQGRIENQQTLILKVWWQDSAGEDRPEPAELALSIPAAAKLADFLQQTVDPYLRYSVEDERWT